MAITRRQLLKNAVYAAPAFYLGPKVLLRSAFAAAGGGAKNIVFLELDGGNDGINTIVPYGMNGGSYYTEFRPTIGIPQATLLTAGPLVGFHPALAELKAHFDAGRLAVIQGVSYPNPNFSHDVAKGIWDSGTPSSPYGTGWVGRYIALHPPGAFPSGLQVGNPVDGTFSGSSSLIPSINKVTDFVLPFDAQYSGDKTNRRVAYESIATALAGGAGNTGALATASSDVLELIDTFQSIPAYVPSVTYPNNSLGNGMKLIAQLMQQNLGLRFFHIRYGGFDTHSEQNVNNYHGARLQNISKSLDALYNDLVTLGFADDTIFVVFTEFGRTAYENGSDGTDHGSVHPVLVLGNGVVGGLTTAHPNMDPTDLTSQKQPKMVTDFRNVWGTITVKWLSETMANIFPSYATFTDLGFLG